MSQRVFALLFLTTTPAWAHSVTVLSAPSYMEPSASKASDKDGCPPVSGSADPEEGLLQAKVIATGAVASPKLFIQDTNNPGADNIDDFTLDEFSPIDGAAVASGTRDLDYLDGVLDNSL